MRKCLIIALTISAFGTAFAGNADTAQFITQSPCFAPGTVTVTTFKTLGHDVLENLGFDGLGHLWISDSTSNSIKKYDSRGNLLFSIPVSAPGAITKGPDGWLYVNTGDALAGSLLRTGAAAVYKFDPSQSSPSLTLVSSGFNMANGATFDQSGYLYVSNDFDSELVRIDPADPSTSTNWTVWSDVYGTNGLVALPPSTGVNGLLAAITFDQRSPIEQIDLGDPAIHRTVAELSFGALSLEPGATGPNASPVDTPAIPKGLDDMTITQGSVTASTVSVDAAANGSGEVLRTAITFTANQDASTATCLLTGGLQNPSSLRYETGFDGSGDLFVTEFSGNIRRIHITG